MKLPTFLARPLLLLIALLAPALPAWSVVSGVTFTSPAQNDVCRNTITLTYTMGGSAAIEGTAFVTFSTEHTTYGYSFTSAASTAGPHSFTFDPTQPELCPELITMGQPHIAPGVYDVRLYGFDSAGLQQMVTHLNVTVSYSQPPARPGELTHELRYVKGGLVPLDLTDGQVQEEAVWSGFGTPAVNENGQIAFIGKWKAPATLGTPSPQSGTGLWLDNQLLFYVGSAIPNSGSVFFKSFRDPVIDRFGRVAFIATLKGDGITSANDSVIVSNVGGTFHIVAQEGTPAPGTGGVPFKSFTSVAIKADAVVTPAPGPTVAAGSGGLYFTGKLNLPAVSTNDDGAWWQPTGASAVSLLIREGDTIPGSEFGVDPVKSFQLLRALSGSPAQGRGPVSGHEALLQISFLTGGFQAIARVTSDGTTATYTRVIATGGSVDGVGAGVTWKKLGSLPTVSDDGQKISILASILEANKTVSKGIFQTVDGGAVNGGGSWSSVVLVDAFYGSFKDPVGAADSDALAFLNSNKIGATITANNNDIIYWKKPGAGLTGVVREGDQPPGAPAGAQWKSFSSLALPEGGGGPIFTAMLRKGLAGAPGPGGITSIDDFGLYGTTTGGSLLELLRENQPLGSTGKTVKNFTVLKAAAGSPGVQRNFHGSTVVALVNFVDKTSGIVVISIP